MSLTTTGYNDLLTNGLTSFTHISAYEDLGTTETSTTRQAVTWASAGSGLRLNSGSLSIPITAGRTIQVGSLHDGVTGGNLLGIFQIGSTLRGAGNVLASTDLITSYSHGLTTDDRIFFHGVLGDTLPTGPSTTTLYFVLASGLTTDAFKVSTTSGGSALDFTTNGEFEWFKTVPNTFASSGNLTIANNALTFDATPV